MADGHTPVLLGEVMEVLQPGEGRRMLDATFGRGGHSRAMLATGASVVALDRDADAEVAAQSLTVEFPGAFRFRRANFSALSAVAEELGPFDGILLDLGVSSPQLDTAARGFSFQQDGPLDMRMDQAATVSAAELVNRAAEPELAELIFKFGDEPRARRIARAMVSARAREKITRTAQLAAVVEAAVGGRRGAKIHPATKTFQALRIAVNDELGALRAALTAAPAALTMGGRLGVISFHSLEDRLVKQFIATRSEPELRGEGQAFGWPNPDYCFRKIGRWLPADTEVAANPRARSARLRGAERIA
ncbi:MAG: 16S rRNA (cytosine(1402)-N(4))-methyltransferase RsmH [Verrucomicrobiales bacterium]|jgi:16S rRNA (cytosine1402-N4)-methyltransferase|nr:16S rRNA (cytosine(1402)-N(4))-methyltransferase RsmH [Verrucomicrobiales bacterium]